MLFKSLKHLPVMMAVVLAATLYVFNNLIEKVTKEKKNSKNHIDKCLI